MRTPAQDDADYGESAHLSVRVSVHLCDHTTVEVATYPAERRATIGLSGYRQSAGVILFGRVPELRELRDLLTDTLTILNDTDTDDAVASDTTDVSVGDRAA